MASEHFFLTDPSGTPLEMRKCYGTAGEAHETAAREGWSGISTLKTVDGKCPRCGEKVGDATAQET